MSYLRPNLAGVYDIPSLNASSQLYIRGKKFEDYINELVFEDQLEQAEINEIKLLLEYLDTTGLNSAWTVTNSNVNETLRSAITALQTKLANIDTTALTESSVLTNDNRNSVLKTRLDTAASDLTALTTRVTTAEGDIDNLETRMTTAETDIDNLETRETAAETNITGILEKTKYIQVYNGDPNNDETKHTIYIGSNMESVPNTAQHKLAYFGTTGYAGFKHEYIPNDEKNEVMMYAPFGGTAHVMASHTRISGYSSLNIGEAGTGLGLSETINIGGAMSSINIGSVEDPRIGTGFPIPDSDYNNSTKITIGKRTALKNTWTYLQGNFYTSESRWEDLAVTDVVTFETAASWFAGYVFSGGLPYWLAWVGLSGTPNYRYSDVVKMADNYLTGGLTKNHAIETSNDISVQRIRVMDFTVVSLSTAFDAILARLVFQAFAVHGSHSIGSVWGRTNIYAGSGEVELRVDGGAFDWAFKNAGNCNRVFLDNDHVEVVQCNGSTNTGRLRLVAAAGNIELSTGYGGVRANASKIMEITYLSQIIIGEDTTMTDTTYKMLIDTTSHANGIKVAKGSNALLLNPDNVSSKSLTLQSGYTGTTTNTLYTNADGKLMFNGVELGANLGGGGGGLEYYIPLASNITNPAPNPTAQLATETYTNAPQRTITQSTTAVATALRMARYETAIINKESNPFVEGLQTIQQYLTWSENNTVGQLYGECWFQAEASAGAIVYERTYTPGVTTLGLNVLSGKPILAPNGLFNLSVKSVEFPGITIDTFSGATVTIKCRLEAQDLITANWTILQTSNTQLTFGPAFDLTTHTLTFTEDFVHNQTTKVNAPNAYRFVLFTTSPNTSGHLVQANSGTVAGDEIAYRLGSGGTVGSVRVLLYDGVNAKQTITHTTTPLLVPIELPISPPYEIGPFNNGRLAFDIFMYQPSGAVNANHQMRFFFGEGTISHIESTINEPPAPTPTLAQVLNSGATASQNINMNTHKISGITTLEGSSNGNWNVKEITAGTGIGVTPTNGSYAIANTGILSVSAASGTPGITATTTNGAVTLQNSGILSITAGTGISVSTTNGVAQITNTGVGPTQVSVAQQLRDEHQSLYEVGALPRKPAYWATNWSVADTTSVSHRDIYVSVDGKIIASATGDYPIRYSTNYGTTWNNGNVNLEWTSICGTSDGSRLFAFGIFQAPGPTFSLVFYKSINQGATWTSITSSVFTGSVKVNRVRCSGDGKYLLASDNTQELDAQILYSNNGGDTWVKRQIADLPRGKTEGVAMSRSGAIQFVTWINEDSDNSRILRSTDYGSTFSEVIGHQPGGNWTRIECDATGRYVVATRFVNISTPIVEGWRSDDYGSSWSAAGIYGIEDIWVSATGQFVAGVSNPQSGGVSYLIYSTDYGRSFTGVPNPASSVNNTYRTINGNADGSILVLGSANTPENGFNGDGLLRIARSGTENIYDLLQDHNALWYATNIKSSSANSSVSFPINATYGDINFDTHNIEYEIEINWDRHTSFSPAAHIRMGFNGIYNEIDTHSANTTWVLRLEQAFTTIHDANQGAIAYDQHYNNRFYCGYSAGQGTGDIYRYRTLLTGKLRVQKRIQAQTADLGSYSADWSLDARTLTNRFTSDNYAMQVTQFSAMGPDRAKLGSQTNFDDGLHCVSGTSVWELTDAGAWELGYGGAYTALKDGIKNINLSFVNNPNVAGINRSYDISARFWRVRK